MFLLKKVRLFFALPIQQQYWFISCYLLSGFVRAIILALPFRWLQPYLGLYYQNIQLTALATQQQQRLARQIGHITQLACKFTPWESKCLVQAILARHLLKFYHIPCVLYLGVKTSKPNNKLKAHAWLCAGRVIVTGREGHRPFAIVSTFVSPPQLVTHSSS